MKYSRQNIGQDKNILANDHFVAISYDCTNLSSLATGGVIPAGTIIPSNDSEAIGVLLNDVCIDENPNGAVVVHGFIDTSKLPEKPTEDTTSDSTTTVGAKTVLKQIMFM